MAAVEPAMEEIRAGEAFQIVVRQRFEMRHDGRRARHLPGAARYQPEPVHVPAALRRLRHRRAPARRRWSRCTGGPGDAAPDRRHPAARRHAGGGRRAGGGAARRPEGARRAPDAGRPRAATTSAGSARRAPSRWSTSWPSSATATSCTSCRPSSARLAPGRTRLRRARAPASRPARCPARRSCARWRSSRSSSRPGAGCTAAPSATSTSPATWTWRSRSGPRCCATAWRTCRPAPASSPTPTRRPRTPSTRNKAAAVAARGRGGGDVPDAVTSETPVDPAPPASPNQAARRQFFVALALVLAGAALVLWAAGRTWLAARWAIPNYPAVHTSVTGAQAAPLARSAGFLGLAGVLAVLATRGRGRQVAGGLVALAGVAAVASAVTFWTRTGAVAEAAVRRAIAGGAEAAGAAPQRPRRRSRPGPGSRWPVAYSSWQGACSQSRAAGGGRRWAAGTTRRRPGVPTTTRGRPWTAARIPRTPPSVTDRRRRDRATPARR